MTEYDWGCLVPRRFSTLWKINHLPLSLSTSRKPETSTMIIYVASLTGLTCTRKDKGGKVIVCDALIGNNTIQFIFHLFG